jgi:hypothetical protein
MILSESFSMQEQHLVIWSSRLLTNGLKCNGTSFLFQWPEPRKFHQDDFIKISGANVQNCPDLLLVPNSAAAAV